MRRMSLLRSWEEFPVEFYKHHAPTERRAERLAFRVCQQYQDSRRSIHSALLNTRLETAVSSALSFLWRSRKRLRHSVSLLRSARGADLRRDKVKLR
jgi:hypothetical protein